MKVALVYDRVNKWGGAERVLLALHKLFPNASLYTSVYDPKNAPWASVFNVKTSFLQKFPLASSSHEYYAILMPLAFESFSFDEYDFVISITSEAAKGILTKPSTFHLCYCLTPTRYLWSGYNDYFESSLLRFLSKPAVSYLREWDKIAAQRPDAYVAISKEVQGRIKKYYDRESEVVYPPVTLGERGKPPKASLAKGGGKGERKEKTSPFTFHPSPYFLVVSRLVQYKRVDIAIIACNVLKLPLIVIGTGSEEKKLKRMAGPTITFLGSLTEDKLVEYYRNCRALLFCGNEDLGLTIIEAQRFGKPVIAFKSGGALETIIQGTTGEFFHRQDANSLIEVLRKFDENIYSSNQCKKNAAKFSFERFRKEFENFFERKLREYQR